MHDRNVRVVLLRKQRYSEAERDRVLRSLELQRAAFQHGPLEKEMVKYKEKLMQYTLRSVMSLATASSQHETRRWEMGSPNWLEQRWRESKRGRAFARDRRASSSTRRNCLLLRSVLDLDDSPALEAVEIATSVDIAEEPLREETLTRDTQRDETPVRDNTFREDNPICHTLRGETPNRGSQRGETPIRDTQRRETPSCDTLRADTQIRGSLGCEIPIRGPLGGETPIRGPQRGEIPIRDTHHRAQSTTRCSYVQHRSSARGSDGTKSRLSTAGRERSRAASCDRVFRQVKIAGDSDIKTRPFTPAAHRIRNIIQFDTSLSLRECWAGDPEAIDSIRRPLVTSSERELQRHMDSVMGTVISNSALTQRYIVRKPVDGAITLFYMPTSMRHRGKKKLPTRQRIVTSPPEDPSISVAEPKVTCPRTLSAVTESTIKDAQEEGEDEEENILSCLTI